MTTALATTNNPMIAEWESKLDLIKRTVANGATNDELQLFFHQAHRSGLDPLARQIYFVKRQGKGTIQTGIDGYRLIADRTGKYAGNDDYEFDDPEGQPKWAKATVYKMVDGVRCPFTATARWSQYYPGDAQGWAWKKMPHLMLGKCAEALALRKAFPADLSGIYTNEEMEQADRRQIAEVATEEEDAPPPPKRVVTGTVSDIQTTDKGTFYKMHDGEEEHICMTANPSFVKKLAGVHGLYVEFAVHSQDIGKAKLIVDVLHIKEPEDLTQPLQQMRGGYDDDKGLACGMVKTVFQAKDKKPLAVVVVCGDEEVKFSTFHKTPQERLANAKGQYVELTYTLDGKYRNIKEVLRVGQEMFADPTTITQEDAEAVTEPF